MPPAAAAGLCAGSIWRLNVYPGSGFVIAVGHVRRAEVGPVPLQMSRVSEIDVSLTSEWYSIP